MKSIITVLFLLVFAINSFGQHTSQLKPEDGPDRRYFVMGPVGMQDKPYSWFILSPDEEEEGRPFGSIGYYSDRISETEYQTLSNFLKQYYYSYKDTNIVWQMGNDFASNPFATDFYRNYDKKCSNCYSNFLYEHKQVIYGYNTYTDEESKEHIDALINLIGTFANGAEIISDIRHVYNQRYIKKGFELDVSK